MKTARNSLKPIFFLLFSQNSSPSLPRSSHILPSLSLPAYHSPKKPFLSCFSSASSSFSSISFFACAFILAVSLASSAFLEKVALFVLSSGLSSTSVTVGPALTLMADSTRGRPQPRHDQSWSPKVAEHITTTSPFFTMPVRAALPRGATVSTYTLPFSSSLFCWGKVYGCVLELLINKQG